MPPCKYTREYTIQYCKDNDVEIVIPDESVKFNRELKLMTKCKATDCQNQSYHTIRYIIEKQSYNCKLHTNEIGIIKKRKTNIERYGCEYSSQNEGVKDKVKATNNERYGCEHSFHNEDVKDKAKATIKERYGCEYAIQNNDVKERVKITNLERFGCEYSFQNEDVKDKARATNVKRLGCEYPSQNEEVRDKARATNVKRLGCEYPLQNIEIKDRAKATNIGRYGCEYGLQNIEVQERGKLTNIERYGFENVMQNKEVQEKGKLTNTERYGCEYAMQNSIIAERAMKNAYSSYPYTLPSGSIRNLQGYERYAMDILLKSYDENDIITDRSKVPELWYDGSDGVQHRYFVDIFLPKENKMIEVKSTWTYERDEEKVQLTKEVAQNLGMLFECWIISPKGEILYII